MEDELDDVSSKLHGWTSGFAEELLPSGVVEGVRHACNQCIPSPSKGERGLKRRGSLESPLPQSIFSSVLAGIVNGCAAKYSSARLFRWSASGCGVPGLQPSPVYEQRLP